MRIAIVGFGRMGRAVQSVATARGHDVALTIGRGELETSSLSGVDVAIEFTAPDAAADNLIRLAHSKVPTVSGTTGWFARLDEVRAAFERENIGLVYAPNFSLGVQLLLRVAREMGRLAAARPEFEAWIVETHHSRKRDAPSGTAKALQNALRAEDHDRPYPVTSIRAGDVPGTHSLTFDAPGESLELTHTARERSVFATGAVVAAEWLTEHPISGVRDFASVVFPEDQR